MTIRAIDMQTMLPRLNEAGRTQQQLDQQPQVAQHAQAVTAQQKAELARRQIQQKSGSERLAGRQHGGSREDGGKGQTGNRKPSATKEEGLPEEHGHRLDVKI